MSMYNPYLVSLSAGIGVYLLTKSKTKENKKDVRQTNLNYVFITILFVFILMKYLSTNNTTSLEPTLDCKFDE